MTSRQFATTLLLSGFGRNDEAQPLLIVGDGVREQMVSLSHDYVTQLARAIDGEVNPGQRGDWYVVRNGKSPKIDDLLRRQDAWIAAVESFTSRANDRLLQAGTS